MGIPIGAPTMPGPPMPPPRPMPIGIPRPAATPFPCLAGCSRTYMSCAHLPPAKVAPGYFSASLHVGRRKDGKQWLVLDTMRQLDGHQQGIVSGLSATWINRGSRYIFSISRAGGDQWHQGRGGRLLLCRMNFFHLDRSADQGNRPLHDGHVTHDQSLAVLVEGWLCPQGGDGFRANSGRVPHGDRNAWLGHGFILARPRELP